MDCFAIVPEKRQKGYGVQLYSYIERMVAKYHTGIREYTISLQSVYDVNSLAESMMRHMVWDGSTKGEVDLSKVAKEIRGPSLFWRKMGFEGKLVFKTQGELPILKMWKKQFLQSEQSIKVIQHLSHSSPPSSCPIQSKF